jgi:centrosomal protein CEP350
MNQSSSEIKSWERTLVDRTRGQISWLELQKQNFRKHGQMDKVSAIKKQQRAILLRLERERAKLRENSERSLVKVEDVPMKQERLERDVTAIGNASDARENIER